MAVWIELNSVSSCSGHHSNMQLEEEKKVEEGKEEEEGKQK